MNNVKANYSVQVDRYTTLLLKIVIRLAFEITAVS